MTSDPSSADNDLTVVSPHTIAQPSRTVSVMSSDENTLPVGTVLEEFEITGLIGRGGFGIVYLAHDRSLQRQVALKEYMPAALAVRNQGVTVSVKSEQCQETFQAGLRSFINEARLLAQFDHPSLVKVYRFWEDNGTAYMVMPFYQGVTLKETLRTMSHPPDEAWLKHLLAQLLDALDVLHRDHCFHRDIAPDNILILSDGHALLLDFGAARRVISDMTQALTVILKPGYAPIEQYAETDSMKQGPWTDIYALAAVVYLAVTGKAPVPSVSRMLADTLDSLSQVAAGRYSAGFLQGIDSALATRPENRPQNIDELRALLGIPRGRTTAESKPSTKTAKSKRPWWIYTAIFIALTATISTALILTGNQEESSEPSVPLSDTAGINTKKSFDPDTALDEIFDNRDRDHAVTVSIRKAQVRINKDPLHFQIISTQPGYVYLLMVGTNRSDFFLLFPNQVDKDNHIEANEQFELPRPSWKMFATGPAGINHFVVMVSNQPRDFSHTGLQTISPFAEFPYERASGLYRTYTGTIPLFAGKVICPSGSDHVCSEAYGAAVFSIEEIEGM